MHCIVQRCVGEASSALYMFCTTLCRRGELCPSICTVVVVVVIVVRLGVLVVVVSVFLFVVLVLFVVIVVIAVVIVVMFLCNGKLLV